jgi:AcrR family transcriptional regulator
MTDTDDKPDRVRDACDHLVRAGQTITFDAVADAVGVSRATLYRRRELREIVERYRDPEGQQLTVTRLADQIDQLRDSLEAVADRVRRHEEELRRLKNNKTG